MVVRTLREQREATERSIVRKHPVVRMEGGMEGRMEGGMEGRMEGGMEGRMEGGNATAIAIITTIATHTSNEPNDAI